MQASFLKPGYWPIWVALGLIRLLTWLPYRAQRQVGFAIGRIVRLVARRRREITHLNIQRCFPDKTVAEQQQLERRHFESLGLGLIELGMSWWASDHTMRKLVQIEGLEHLEAAQAPGRGVVLLTAHFTTLEIGGSLLTQFTPSCAMYRPNHNALLDSIIRNGRERHAENYIRRDDVRGLLRSLKRGRTVWYAPDQSYRGKNSVTVPFFGIPAPTNPATSRIAKVSGAAIVPFFVERLDGAAGYRLTLLPPLDDFPTKDEKADTARVNAILEAAIRKRPEQYLWSHDRFKLVPRKNRS